MILSLALAALGVGAVVLTRWFVPGQAQWLDSGEGVSRAILLLSLLAVPVGAFCWPVQPRTWRRPISLWLGANIGLAGVLVAAGGAARNLFPFAVVLQAAASAAAIVAGTVVGYILRLTWARVR